jgi:glutaredoxin
MEVCKDAEKGANVLVMLPDTGERYLSTPLFDDIPVDMSAEEIEIADSTPGYRFGGPPPPPPAEKKEEEEDEVLVAPEDAAQFVTDVTSDADEPVVMFSHEWCEFCWSVRKMFAKYEIPYRSVDLDSVEYQKDNKGGKIRVALRERTDSKTIPQIFFGGAVHRRRYGTIRRSEGRDDAKTAGREYGELQQDSAGRSLLFPAGVVTQKITLSGLDGRCGRFGDFFIEEIHPECLGDTGRFSLAFHFDLDF